MLAALCGGVTGCGPKERALPPAPATVNTGQYAAIVDRIAASYSVPPSIVLAIIEVESGGNARAVSPAGAKGLMQLSPATARKYGLGDPFNAAANIEAGVRLLRDLLVRYHGDMKLALAAYNSGPRAVDAAGGVPTRSKPYVDSVLRTAARYSCNRILLEAVTADMTDEEVSAYVGKPVRLTLADGQVLAGVLFTEQGDGHGHGHHHYMVKSAPVREGEEGERAVIHGSEQITTIEDASGDPAATLS